MFLNFLKNINVLYLILGCWNSIRRWGWKALHYAFNLICVLTTLSLIIWCGYEFSKDEDVCEVVFKRFYEDKESIYPDLIIGISNEFNESALKTYNPSFNKSSYLSFVRGGSDWNENMLDVDFEKVTMRIQDYVIQACVYETMKFDVCKNLVKLKTRHFFGFTALTLHFVSKRRLADAKFKLKGSLFSNGQRRPKRFVIYFAFPSQFYRAHLAFHYKWPLGTNFSTTNYEMQINLKGMEVLRKRKKTSKDCYDGENYDGHIKDAIIKKSGCRPIMWRANRSEPLCTTKPLVENALKEHLDQIYRVESNNSYPEPCLNIERIVFDYAIHDSPKIDGNSDDDDEGWLTLNFTPWTDTFKEIKQVRKYSVQSLIGNAGGYIGMCLGYALWNVPTIVVDLWKHMKDI